MAAALAGVSAVGLADERAGSKAASKADRSEQMSGLWVDWTAALRAGPKGHRLAGLKAVQRVALSVAQSAGRSERSSAGLTVVMKAGSMADRSEPLKVALTVGT